MTRLGIALLVAASLYLGTTLAVAIFRTAHLEHDSAYYCEVTERWLDGEGFTSLSDRRGPADPEDFPQPFRGTNRWPWLLAGICSVTVEVPRTAMFVSLAAFLGAIWLGAWTIVRGVRSAWPAAALCVVIALCHKRALEATILPLSDASSLLCNIAVIAALVSKRNLLALVLTALACVTRFQNVALLFPLAWCALRTVPRLRLALLAGGVLAGILAAGSRAGDGIWAFLDASDRASLLRATRWMFLPMVVGMVVARRDGLGPFIWLLVGHFAVLLANEVPSEEPSWLFGMRHGWPFHFTAAACAAAALTRVRGVGRWILAIVVLVGAIDLLPRPYRIARDRPERTSLDCLAPMYASLRDDPLPEHDVVLTHEADSLAYELGIRSIHLRGIDETDPELVRRLRARGVTHVLLRWIDMPVLAQMNARMTSVRDVLAPHLVEDRVTITERPASRVVLFRWRER